MNVRNKDCHCGSLRKYKKCHLYEDQGWKQTDKGFINESIITLQAIKDLMKSKNEEG